MFTKVNRWIFAGLATLVIVSFAVLTAPERAFAAPTMKNPAENSCLSCHEDLYYLHDAGCWYCMTDAHKDRCTDCHEGNPDVFKMEESHIGMLRHPQENNGAKCQECHAVDTQNRIDVFAVRRGGYTPVISDVAYTPVQAVETGFPETARPNMAEKLPWMAGAVVIFGLWLALVLHSPQKP